MLQKTFILNVAFALFFLATACSRTPIPAEENKAVVQRWITEGVNNQNLDLMNELFAADYMGHGVSGEFHGRDRAREVQKAYFRAFPDLQISVEDLIASEDMVVVRWRATGTHKGELAGVPPTGNTVDVNGIIIYRVVEGQLAEEWEYFDELGMWKQIGTSPM